MLEHFVQEKSWHRARSPESTWVQTLTTNRLHRETALSAALCVYQLLLNGVGWLQMRQRKKHETVTKDDQHSCSFPGIHLTYERLNHMYSNEVLHRHFAADVFVVMLHKVCGRRHGLGVMVPAVLQVIVGLCPREDSSLNLVLK
jgi:hypothetical protein